MAQFKFSAGEWIGWFRMTFPADLQPLLAGATATITATRHSPITVPASTMTGTATVVTEDGETLVVGEFPGSVTGNRGGWTARMVVDRAGQSGFPQIEELNFQIG
jgi:hypothetical protein